MYISLPYETQSTKSSLVWKLKQRNTFVIKSCFLETHRSEDNAAGEEEHENSDYWTNVGETVSKRDYCKYVLYGTV